MTQFSSCDGMDDTNLLACDYNASSMEIELDFFQLTGKRRESEGRKGWRATRPYEGFKSPNK